MNGGGGMTRLSCIEENESDQGDYTNLLYSSQSKAISSPPYGGTTAAAAVAHSSCSSSSSAIPNHRKNSSLLSPTNRMCSYIHPMNEGDSDKQQCLFNDCSIDQTFMQFLNTQGDRIANMSRSPMSQISSLHVVSPNYQGNGTSTITTSHCNRYTPPTPTTQVIQNCQSAINDMNDIENLLRSSTINHSQNISQKGGITAQQYISNANGSTLPSHFDTDTAATLSHQQVMQRYSSLLQNGCPPTPPYQNLYSYQLQQPPPPHSHPQSQHYLPVQSSQFQLSPQKANATLTPEPSDEATYIYSSSRQAGTAKAQVQVQAHVPVAVTSTNEQRRSFVSSAAAPSTMNSSSTFSAQSGYTSQYEEVVRRYVKPHLAIPGVPPPLPPPSGSHRMSMNKLSGLSAINQMQTVGLFRKENPEQMVELNAASSASGQPSERSVSSKGSSSNHSESSSQIATSKELLKQFSESLLSPKRMNSPSLRDSSRFFNDSSSISSFSNRKKTLTYLELQENQPQLQNYFIKGTTITTNTMTTQPPSISSSSSFSSFSSTTIKEAASQPRGSHQQSSYNSQQQQPNMLYFQQPSVNPTHINNSYLNVHKQSSSVSMIPQQYDLLSNRSSTSRQHPNSARADNPVTRIGGGLAQRNDNLKPGAMQLNAITTANRFLKKNPEVNTVVAEAAAPSAVVCFPQPQRGVIGIRRRGIFDDDSPSYRGQQQLTNEESTEQQQQQQQQQKSETSLGQRKNLGRFGVEQIPSLSIHNIPTFESLVLTAEPSLNNLDSYRYATDINQQQYSLPPATTSAIKDLIRNIRSDENQNINRVETCVSFESQEQGGGGLKNVRNSCLQIDRQLRIIEASLQNIPCNSSSRFSNEVQMIIRRVINEQSSAGSLQKEKAQLQSVMQKYSHQATSYGSETNQLAMKCESMTREKIEILERISEEEAATKAYGKMQSPTSSSSRLSYVPSVDLLASPSMKSVKMNSGSTVKNKIFTNNDSGRISLRIDGRHHQQQLQQADVNIPHNQYQMRVSAAATATATAMAAGKPPLVKDKIILDHYFLGSQRQKQYLQSTPSGEHSYSANDSQASFKSNEINGLLIKGQVRMIQQGSGQRQHNCRDDTDKTMKSMFQSLAMNSKLSLPLSHPASKADVEKLYEKALMLSVPPNGFAKFITTELNAMLR